MKYSPMFFQLKEFACPDCGRVRISAALVYWLDHLRRAWDGPIAVNSGWRCATRNKFVGGSDVSRHLIGCAADIRVHDHNLMGPFKMLVGHLVYGLVGKNGWEVVYYPTFVHVAVSRVESNHLWSGGTIDVIMR